MGVASLLRTLRPGEMGEVKPFCLAQLKDACDGIEDLQRCILHMSLFQARVVGPWTRPASWASKRFLRLTGT